jgi:type II secretory pathway pseudopilin PulG
MASLLESVGQQLTPEVLGTIGKAIGVDSTQVQKGLEAVGPVVEGALADKSKTTAGMDSIMKSLPDASATGSITDMIGGILKGGPSGAMASSALLSDVFGQGASAVGKTLSAKLGFDVTPLLAAAVPALMGAVSRVAKEQKLDSAGIAQLLQTEQANTLANAKPEVLAAINEVNAATATADALRKKFTDAEWGQLRLAPTAAAYYVMSASPSGPVGSLKELSAAGDAMKAVLNNAGATSLANVAFGTIAGLDEASGAINEKSSRESMLAAIKGAAEAVKAKAPEESVSFAETIGTLAQKVAEAAKEGGFLGIGAKQINAQEQQALNEIKAALA